MVIAAQLRRAKDELMAESIVVDGHRYFPLALYNDEDEASLAGIALLTPSDKALRLPAPQCMRAIANALCG